MVEATGEDVGQLYRRLREVAEQIAQGQTDGDYEYHIYDLEN